MTCLSSGDLHTDDASDWTMGQQKENGESELTDRQLLRPGHLSDSQLGFTCLMSGKYR